MTILQCQRWELNFAIIFFLDNCINRIIVYRIIAIPSSAYFFFFLLGKLISFLHNIIGTQRCDHTLYQVFYISLNFLSSQQFQLLLTTASKFILKNWWLVPVWMGKLVWHSTVSDNVFSQTVYWWPIIHVLHNF